VWGWDITRLAGPAKWIWYYLYVVLDVYSRYVVGWMVAHREAASLAERLLAATITAQQVPRRHAHWSRRPGHLDDRQAGRPAAQRPGRGQVPRPPARARRQPLLEAQFKTLKHHPTFPDRFGSIQDARAFLKRFFDWSNHAHRHSGIALLTPADVHYGRAKQILAGPAAVLEAPSNFPADVSHRG
jgi:putative transposase